MHIEILELGTIGTQILELGRNLVFIWNCILLYIDAQILELGTGTQI